MQILHGFDSIAENFKGSVVTIGNFDGVHLGHQELLKSLVAESSMAGVPSVVVTFDPHPVKVLYPQRKTERLFDLRDQHEQFDQMGIQYCVVQKFDLQFASLSAETFFESYLFQKLNPRTLVVGHDFSFGSQRTGNLDFLEKKCADRGIKLIIVPPFKLKAQPVSSSRIREALKRGDLTEVRQCLGRDYYLRGQVETGFQRGRTIGVPTANITPDVEFIPRQGVYFTHAYLNQKAHLAITNIGINPTFVRDNSPALKIETHIFDFDAQIYGLDMSVTLLQFWRDERKFEDVNALKEQIFKDIQAARDFFRGQKV